ncbi:MAG TPA: FKBP-type peptidyl-prolyl cis-trans isomerase [Vicinamibacterales bacterium]|jgi:FKBP-type peptidyl-prolyl cis-trans isomerase FkpA|nr:FKBP-type peptidyl-prolyl cis-trans isomerase [Vicinamibacterales bacterium]
MSCLSWFVCAVALLVGAGGCGNSNTPSSPSSQPRGEFAQLDLRVGTSAVASTGRSLTVNYTGWLYDPTRPDNKGTQFDTGTFPFVLGAGAVIRGWDTGVVGMRVGGLRRLTIPPELGYGTAGKASIPPNATLVFDIELLSVQ